MTRPSISLAACTVALGCKFDDDHSNVDYRMDVSLPFLYRALTT